MDRPGTERRTETEQASRALVVCRPSEAPRRIVGGRPMVGFLTQLIVGTDPTMRTSRSERTRVAASLYARAAGSR